MACKNRQSRESVAESGDVPVQLFEMRLEAFWDRLQELIPPDGEITWARLWREFGREGTGLYIVPLLQKGMIRTTYKGYIRIDESRRGERIG